MATEFSLAKNSLADISQRIVAERNRIAQARAGVATAIGVLDAMPTQYGTIIADIATNAATPGWDGLKAESDLLVAEFMALQVSATALKAAMDGVA